MRVDVTLLQNVHALLSTFRVNNGMVTIYNRDIKGLYQDGLIRLETGKRKLEEILFFRWMKQKQPSEVFYKKRCRTHRKTPMPEFLF